MRKQLVLVCIICSGCTNRPMGELDPATTIINHPADAGQIQLMEDAGLHGAPDSGTIDFPDTGTGDSGQSLECKTGKPINLGLAKNVEQVFVWADDTTFLEEVLNCAGAYYNIDVSSNILGQPPFVLDPHSTAQEVTAKSGMQSGYLGAVNTVGDHLADIYRSDGKKIWHSVQTATAAQTVAADQEGKGYWYAYAIDTGQGGLLEAHYVSGDDQDSKIFTWNGSSDLQIKGMAVMGQTAAIGYREYDQSGVLLVNRNGTSKNIIFSQSNGPSKATVQIQKIMISGKHFMVVWQDEKTSPSQNSMSFVSSDGTLSGPTSLSSMDVVPYLSGYASRQGSDINILAQDMGQITAVNILPQGAMVSMAWAKQTKTLGVGYVVTDQTDQDLRYRVWFVPVSCDTPQWHAPPVK